jgi:hypothetical protein
MRVEAGSDPIVGSLSARDGRTWAFTGWIALVMALDEALRAPTGEPLRSRAHQKDGEEGMGPPESLCRGIRRRSDWPPGASRSERSPQ